MLGRRCIAAIIATSLVSVACDRGNRDLPPDTPKAADASYSNLPIDDDAGTETVEDPGEVQFAPATTCDSHLCLKAESGSIGIDLISADESSDDPVVLADLPDPGQLSFFITSDVATDAPVQLTLSTAAVPGTPLGTPVATETVIVSSNSAIAQQFLLPGNEGLLPGTYQLRASSDGFVTATLQLDVHSDASADMLRSGNTLFGPNIALAALGGEVVSVSDSYSDGGWLPENLIDGFTEIYNDRGTVLSRGWGARRTTSADLVFAFRDRESAMIEAVGFSPIETTASPRTLAEYERASPIPKGVEVWVSDTEADAGFRKVAEARLYRATIPQLVSFEPAEARYVKIRLLNTHGANEIALGEMMIFEAVEASPSLLSAVDVNLADPALGGFVASVTSVAEGNGAWSLVDGTSSSDSGWMSSATATRPATFTPQDVVFGFGNDDVAFVDRIEIDPLAGPAFSVGDMSGYQAKEIVVSTAMQPGDEWEEIGRLAVPRDNSVQSIEVGREAARVRIRVLANHGGSASSLGEVRIIEGKQDGYVSLARGARTWIGPKTPGVEARNPVERQATTAAVDVALPRGEERMGRLGAVEQTDRYRLTVDTPSTAALAVRLTGQPNVRTSLRLLDSRGSLVKSFIPYADAGEAIALTWLVAPGDYTAEVTETPIVQAVTFDTSGSMSGRINALEEAVRRYVAGARADEFLNLVRFHGKVESLLPEFSSDKKALADALDGQFEADGGTALMDALRMSIELARSKRGRQVIVAFTDGQDTSSEITSAALNEYIAAGPLLLYSIGLGESLASYNRRTASSGHQYLAALSRTMAGSHYFPVRDTSDLDATFAAISAELRAPADYSISADFSDKNGSLRLSTTGEMIPGLSPPRIELIIDASGSMKRASGKQSRMEVAKAVLKSVVEQIPDNTEIGLRAFGHRIAEGQAGDCQDSELIVPFIAGDRERISVAIDGLTALGTTPIAYSVEQALQDIAAAKADEGTSVVLVTDGEEECREDLQQVVEAARQSGVGFSMNIVGFDLDPQTTLDLSEVAAAGGGGFFAAADADQLNAAMVRVISAPYKVLDGSGETIATGVINGEAVELLAGVYAIRVDASGVNVTIPDVSVEADMTRSIRLKRQGDSVDVEK